MISFLKGKIIHNGVNDIVLDVHDVGYRISVNRNLVLKTGDEKSLFIHQHLREDSDDLYGFELMEELVIFEKLLSVNGVGPKAAMAVMSASNSNKIIQAIESDDLTFFVSIPGIGKKVAAKIILDLKSKISLSQSAGILGKSGEADNVVEALISLGYQKVEAQKILHKMPEKLKDDQERIRWCLKHLGKQQ